MKVSAVVTGVMVAIGMALGFMVGRTTGSGSGSSSDGKADAERSGMGVGGARGSDRSGRRGADGKSNPNAVATIRQVVRKLEYSPMAQMDFDIMFEIYEAIRWMSPEDIETALSELGDSGTNPQTSMILAMMLINLWAKQDGQGAVEYSLLSKNQMTKSMGVMGGLMGWVKHDPEGAWKWFEEHKKEVKKGGMMGGQMSGMMFAALAQRDMGSAFERMSDLSKKEKQSALRMIGMQTVTDPVRREDFIQRLEKLGDDDLRDQSLQSMVTMWAYQDPKGAIDFLESREWEDDVHSQLTRQVASSWANMDPEAALDWRLETIGPDEDRGEAVAPSFAQWMVRDSEGAREWLQRQPSDLRTDSLYQSTANQLQWSNEYEEAVQWAEQIEDQDSRRSTYRDIYHRWNTESEEDATRWLSGLDAESREAIESGAVSSALQATESIELEVVPE